MCMWGGAVVLLFSVEVPRVLDCAYFPPSVFAYQVTLVGLCKFCGSGPVSILFSGFLSYKAFKFRSTSGYGTDISSDFPRGVSFPHTELHARMNFLNLPVADGEFFYFLFNREGNSCKFLSLGSGFSPGSLPYISQSHLKASSPSPVWRLRS